MAVHHFLTILITLFVCQVVGKILRRMIFFVANLKSTSDSSTLSKKNVEKTAKFMIMITGYSLVCQDIKNMSYFAFQSVKMGPKILENFVRKYF